MKGAYPTTSAKVLLELYNMKFALEKTRETAGRGKKSELLGQLNQIRLYIISGLAAFVQPA